MNNITLQSGKTSNKLLVVKKKNPPKERYRLLLEIAPEDRPWWKKARMAAIAEDRLIGRFVMAAIREKLEREYSHIE